MKIGGFDVGTSRVVLMGGGLWMALLSIIIGWGGGAQLILELTITFTVRLVPEAPVWYLWQGLPLPLYMNCYLFNVSNGDRLSLGDQPIVKEMGPYVYSMKFEKYNFTVDDNADTIRYRQNRKYHFEPTMSKGKESDLVTFINVIYITLAHLANTHPVKSVETLDDILVEAGEKLTTKGTVRQLLFDGVSIKPYMDIINDPLLMGSNEKLQFPKQMVTNGSFAVFNRRNNTDDGWWMVGSGISNFKNFGRIVTYHDEPRLDYWKDKICNKIEGTDGTMFQPFLTPKSKLASFYPDICRSLRWLYERPKDSKLGIPTERFQLQDFPSVESDPGSWCFCPHEDTNKCQVSGIASVAPCYHGAPIIVSKPHFYNADEKVSGYVKGLSANRQKHQSYMYLHALTGAPIQGFTRLQYSIEMTNWPTMPSFANISPGIIPFIWIEQSMELDLINMVLIWIIEMYTSFGSVLRILMVLGALGVFGIGAGLAYIDYTSAKVHQVLPQPGVKRRQKRE